MRGTIALGEFSGRRHFSCHCSLLSTLALKVPEQKRSSMTTAGWDISQSQASDTYILPIPATFVINRDGIMLKRFIDPDYYKRAAHEAILTALAIPWSGMPACQDQ